MAKTKDEIEETRHARELRKQVISLRRENAQLRKRNHQLEQFHNDATDEDFSEDIESAIPESKKSESKKSKNSCPKCQSKNIAIFELRDMPYYKCDDCCAKGRFQEPQLNQ